MHACVHMLCLVPYGISHGSRGDELPFCARDGVVSADREYGLSAGITAPGPFMYESASHLGRYDIRYCTVLYIIVVYTFSRLSLSKAKTAREE